MVVWLELVVLQWNGLAESQDMGGRVGGGGGGGGGSGGMERRRSSMRSMTHSDEEAIERQKAMLLRKIARFQKAKSSL
eukprot:gene6599-23963_t